MTHSNLWHRWYAWFPVIAETEDHKLLLVFEDVMRRRVFRDGRYRWQYQPIDSSIPTD
jgi:hypothetical protein